MNDKMTGTGVATGSAGPRLSVRGMVLTAVVGVGVGVGVLFATGAFDGDSDSVTSSNASTVTTAAELSAANQRLINELSQSGLSDADVAAAELSAANQRLIDELSQAPSLSEAAAAAAEHEAAINEIELRNIELKQVFQDQPAEAAVASPATIEGKLAQQDAAANEAFCQACFDEYMAQQQADARADERMADKLAQMDAYDATYGLR